MMSTGLHVRDLRSEASTDLVEQIYRDILNPSFGSNELDTLDTLIEGLAEGGSHEAWGLCAIEGDTPVGCVLGYPFPRSRALLIGYLSVRPGARGTGVGRALLRAARQKWFERADVGLVLAEVEDPRHYPKKADIDPERRASFYAQEGAQIVVGPYFQPRLEGAGKRRVHDLFLIVLGGTSEAISPEKSALRTDVLTDFMVDYFRGSGEGRGWPSVDDKEGNRLLAWYRGREVVELRHMADYREIHIPQVRE